MSGTASCDVSQMHTAYEERAVHVGNAYEVFCLCRLRAEPLPGTTSMELWRAINHWQCGSESTTKPIRPLVAVRLHTGAPQWRHAVCQPRDADMIADRFNRALSVGVSSRELPFNGLVEVAGEHDCAQLRANVADEQQQRDAHGSPFGAFIFDLQVLCGT